MCEALSVFIIIIWGFFSLYLMGQLKTVTGKGEKERGAHAAKGRGLESNWGRCSWFNLLHS